ncbi:MAG: type II toxin-antitoxin system RelE family toxin [Streptosporangiaceae bacterium]
MSLTVVFGETALRGLARVRSDDKEAFAEIRRTVAALADQPQPDGAVAWGGAGIFRLHAGTARILYEVDDEASVVYIINIGRIS